MTPAELVAAAREHIGQEILQRTGYDQVIIHDTALAVYVTPWTFWTWQAVARKADPGARITSFDITDALALLDGHP